MEQVFGSSNFVIISAPRESSYTREGLQKLRSLHKKLDGDPSVEQVHSIFGTNFVKSGPSGFDVQDLAPPELKVQEDFEELRKRLASNQAFKGSLTSLDLQSLALVVEFKPDILDPIKLELIEQISNEVGIDNSWETSGLPVINSQVVALIERDLMLLFPGFMVLLIIVLYLAFRSAIGVILPLIVIMFGITVTVGLMSMLGIALNVVTNNIPMLLTCIGGAYCIHFLNQYQLESASDDRRKRLTATLRHIGPTIFLASITTVLGFLANSSSSVAAVRQFGYFMAIGLCILFLATNLVLPALLYFRPLGIEQTHQTKGRSAGPSGISLLAKLRWPIVAAALLVAIGAAYAATLVKAEYRTLGYFKESSTIVKQGRNISRDYGGFSSFDIIIDTNKKEGVVNSHLLSAMDRFSDWIRETYPNDVRVSVNFSDFIKEMSEAFNGGQSYHRVPQNNDEIFQYLDVYSWTGDVSEDFRNFVDSDWSKVRLTGRLSLQEHKDGSYTERPVQYHSAIIDAGIEWLKNELGGDYKIYPFGEVPIWAKVNKEIISGQIVSVTIAIGFVWLVSFLIFRSFMLSIICLIPVSMAVGVNFIIMALFSINLDIATTLVSSMAIGIGIDDTLHFMLTYRKLKAEGLPNYDAIRKTLATSGRAIIYTSIALVMGFLVFLFSNFQPVVHFGALNALTILIATVATLGVLPATLLLVDSDS